ncbi:MAG: B12-binding domain-containing radical SAM protein [Rhodospirillales bacterium]|nr:B12-binding domain-containing radical SAM protein [Rhodospirillales bacterium]
MDGGITVTAKKPTLALINVMMDGDYQFDEEIPLGVGMIASYLRQNEFPVTIHQCLASQGPEQIELAGKVGASAYGFQLNIVNYQNVLAVVQKIKAHNPKAFIVLGGPFLAALAEPILKNEPLFDAIVVGEGEETMLDLMEKLTEADGGEIDLAAIPGILWRNEEGNIVKNGQRPLIRDLDILPFPARDFLKDSLNHDKVDGGLLESLRIITSRGCVANCNFCAVNFYSKLQKGKLWRGRSAKNVVDELEHLVETYDAHVVNFSDSSFDDPGKKGKERTRDICNDIIDRGLKISAKVYMRADSMLEDEDEDLLRLWKKAGIDVLIVGAESGSDLELEFYEKRADLFENNKIIERIRKLDLFYLRTGMIMFGPNSTLGTLRENIDFMKEWDLADNPTLVSNALMLIRDSKLYDILKEEGRVHDGDNPWDLPKYDWLDPLAKRVGAHWDGIEGRFPVANKMNNVQTETENLFTRLLNPMNAHALDQVHDCYLNVKSRYMSLKKEFNVIQHEYFHRVLNMVEDNSSDEDLEKSGQAFFGNIYQEWYPRYQILHDELMGEFERAELSLSGLVFKNFASAMVKDGTERV